MKTYYWDFFGPRAEGTARHFQKHLTEFLESNGLGACETGLVSEGAGHQGVFCRGAGDRGEIVEKALRPKRFSEE